MSGDDELVQVVARLSKAFDDLARSQDKLTGELAKRCEEQARHFEDVCRALEHGTFCGALGAGDLEPSDRLERKAA